MKRNQKKLSISQDYSDHGQGIKSCQGAWPSQFPEMEKCEYQDSLVDKYVCYCYLCTVTLFVFVYWIWYKIN